MPFVYHFLVSILEQTVLFVRTGVISKEWIQFLLAKVELSFTFEHWTANVHELANKNLFRVFALFWFYFLS